MYKIERYEASRHREEWNSFVAKSKNGTFLFDRNYMDYHQHRFADHSLLFYLKDKLYAVFPANEQGETICSHQGLTYGGLLMGFDATAEGIIALFRQMNDYYRRSGFRRFVYRPTPWIYHLLPSEEDLYAIINGCNGTLIAKEVSTVILTERQQKWSTLRTRCAAKAKKNEVTVSDSNDLATFWCILSENLSNRYQVKPVHTLDEMQLLQSRFPHNIRLVAAFHHSEMIGGILFYQTKQVIHSQYIATNDLGKSLGAIDLIMDETLHNRHTEQPYFDFGKSTEEHGTILNEKLIHQKEGFGGRAICYDTYEWDL